MRGSAKDDFKRGLPIGIGVGIGIGTALGVATKNMGLLTVGLAIGIALAPTFGKARRGKDDQQD